MSSSFREWNTGLGPGLPWELRRGTQVPFLLPFISPKGCEDEDEGREGDRALCDVPQLHNEHRKASWKDSCKGPEDGRKSQEKRDKHMAENGDGGGW